MKLTLRGVEYQSDLLSLYYVSINEAWAIKQNTKARMTIADWRIGLLTFDREDPDVLAGLIYLLRHRAGEDVDWSEIGEINTKELAEGFEWEDSDTDLVNRVQKEQDAKFDEAVKELLDGDPAETQEPEPEAVDPDTQDASEQQGPATA